MNTALCCFALMVFIVAASGQTLVEQDHDHHEDETTFNHLAEITGSSSEDFIDIPAIENLLARLKTRVECAANQACETCLTYETVRSILNISEIVTSFDEHEFARPAALILTMLANDTCTGIDSNVVGSSAIICGPDVITTIRSIAPRYHGSENNTKCFNYATVIGQNCTEHVDDIHYKLLVNLYEGQCILPTPTDMESELFESLGVEGEIVTDVAFTTLLSKLNIGTLNNGSSSTPTVPTDTDHSSHNHRRKRSSHDHDEHEHEKRCYTYDQ
uniref:Saposin B-type domain-containing protein n=1 Tax=Ciona savignyi TaxID=51511 RepID=H2YT27_CIOSA